MRSPSAMTSFPVNIAGASTRHRTIAGDPSALKLAALIEMVSIGMLGDDLSDQNVGDGCRADPLQDRQLGAGGRGPPRSGASPEIASATLAAGGSRHSTL